MPTLIRHLTVGAGLLVACMGSHEPSTLIVPLSRGAAISNTESPAIAARLSFEGQSAWFVFDTGAGAHTLAAWFVDAVDMAIDRDSGGLSALDAGGDPVDLRIVRNQVATLSNGRTLTLPVAIVARFPPVFEAAEVAGLLNPQLLGSKTHAVVLDLRRSELRLERFDGAVARLGAARVPETEVRTCTSDEVAIPNRVFALLVRANGREGWLTLDTGADVTSVNRESPLVEGGALEPGGHPMGIAGRTRPYDRALDLTLSFAGHQATTDAQVVESHGETCGADGLLGLDLIGGCVFVFGEEGLAATCGA